MRRLPQLTIGRMMGLILVLGLALGAIRSPSLGVVPIPGAVAAVVASILLAVARARITLARVLGVVAATLAIPAVAAAIASEALWGYPFERPGPDRRIVGASRVLSVTILRAATDGAGQPSFVAGSPRGIEDLLDRGKNWDEYYVLGERAVIALDERGLVPRMTADDAGLIADSPNRPLPQAALDRLRAVLDATGRLEEGERGYTLAKALSGVAIEATGADGRPLLFVGVRGGEVSNDHHPYYEFLFEGDARTPSPRLLSFRRFYFDVAGIEGIEWPAFFLMFSIPTLLLSTCFGLAAALLRRWKVGRAS